MLVDAVIGAEGAAAAGEDFEFAPAAEGPAGRTFGKRARGDAAAGKGAGKRHDWLQGKAGRQSRE
jgi:hypothetical protein